MERVFFIVTNSNQIYKTCLGLLLTLSLKIVVAQNEQINPADPIVLNNLNIRISGYPKEALENKVEGTVLLAFDLDSTCKIVNPRVLRGIGYGCDEMALQELIRLSYNETVFDLKNCPHSSLEIPIQFRLQ